MVNLDCGPAKGHSENGLHNIFMCVLEVDVQEPKEERDEYVHDSTHGGHNNVHVVGPLITTLPRAVG